MACKRILVVIGAFITPLSLHYVVYRYQIRRKKPLTEEEMKLLRYGGAVNDSPKKKRKGFRKCKSCLKGCMRFMWMAVWLFIPLTLFSMIALGSIISAAAGYHAFLFYFFTFPALALAAHKLWSPKRGVLWPLTLFIILLIILVVGFSVLLSAVGRTANAVESSPTLPLERNNNHNMHNTYNTHSNHGNAFLDSHSLSNTSKNGTYPHQEYMGYQICYSDWNGLDIIDFGLFSYLAYYEYGTPEFDTLFNKWFNTSDWTITAVAPQDNLVSFIEVHSTSLNLSVVSVRGTANVADALEDLALWSEAIQLQGLSLIFPIAFTWPDMSTAVLVQAMSYLTRVLFPPGSNYDYFTEVDQFVETAKLNRTLFLTGHSLGGSIAKVVGARQHIPSVTYCAPGTVYSRRKFDISLDEIEEYTVTVRPTADIISHIDSMGGVVQDVLCDSSTYFPDCHFLDHVMCPMIRVGCGHRKRTAYPLNC